MGEQATQTITPYQAVQGCLQRMDGTDRRFIEHCGDQLSRHGNRLFASGAYAGLVVMPSIITEETGVFEKLDTVRMEQTGAAAIVSANYPFGGDHTPRAQQNIRDIKEYALAYPDFPLSYFRAGYAPKTPIGKVLYDLYGTGIWSVSAAQGPSLANMPLIRWDWDTLSAVNYLPELFAKWEEHDQANKYAYPVVQHDRLDPGRFPNINRSLDWYDLRLRQLGSKYMPEHFAVDVLGYAGSGGMRPHWTNGETRLLVDRMESNSALPPVQKIALENSVVRISCRGIAHRSVHAGWATYGALYSPGTADATHRTVAPARDISLTEYRLQSNWRIRDALNHEGDAAYMAALRRGESPKEAVALAVAYMRGVGAAALQAFDEPASGQKVMDRTIKTWHRGGPPAGDERLRGVPQRWELFGAKQLARWSRARAK